QQEQKNERIACAAAKVQLGGEYAYIGQQGHEKLGVAHTIADTKKQHAAYVKQRQQENQRQHGVKRQIKIQGKPCHQDGHDLTQNGNPAQLDQLQHVLAARGAAIIVPVWISCLRECGPTQGR